MSKIKEEMTARCELALMGAVVDVHSNEEAIMMTEYILGVLNREEVLNNDLIADRICRYNETNEVKHLVCNTIEGMPTITYLIDCKDGETPAPFEEDYDSGCPCAFCYVLNLAEDLFSEFGDCFFEKRQGIYHRIS